MKSILFILTMFLGVNLMAQTHSFESLKAQATSEQKNILLYFSGSDWCAPCMKFKKNFIETDAFKNYESEHLIVYDADFPRKKANQLSAAQTAENEKLADKYNPNGYFPLIILMKSNGDVLKKWESLPNMSVEEFIQKLK